MSKYKAITVRELIDELSKIDDKDKDLPVLADGCDCWGEAARVRITDEGWWGERVAYSSSARRASVRPP